MNKFKKIGISALAGSLAAISANAAEMSVSGSAHVSYVSNDSSEVTGNPYGMNTSLGFTGTGDVNGYETTLFMATGEGLTGMASASLAVDLGDMGTITFDQGVGVGGLSTIDSKTPSAYEEVFDSLDAVTGDKNGLVGMANSGVFVYDTSVYGSNLSFQYGKGQAANNADGAASGATTGSGSSYDVAITNSSLMDGLSVGAGYGKIANAGSGHTTATGGGSDTDEHMTAFVTYTAGGVTVGYQEAVVGDGRNGQTQEYATDWAIAVNLMEGLSASYGERDIEHAKASAAHVTESQEGFAIAYTMGSAKIALQNNEVGNNGGTAGTNDENTEIRLSLSF
jgi:outer membrane protein OmpU